MRTVFFFFACVCVATANDCNNPVFKNPMSWGAKMSQFPKKMIMASEPIAYPSGSQQCSYFKNDKQCCTTETLAAIEDAFADVHAAVDAARNAINNDPWVNRTVHTIEGLVNATCHLALCPHNFREVMAGYLQTVADKSIAVQTAQLDCVQMQLAYMEGMTCFACDADWAKYVNTTSKTITLAEDVCDEVVKGCQPVHNSINSLTSTISEFISTVISWSTLIHINITLDNVADMCGGTFKNPGDCSQYFCHDMLNGIGLPKYGWDPSKDVTTLSTKDPKQVHEWMATNLHSLHRRLFSELASSTAAATTTTSTSKAVSKEPDFNRFNSNGYDAIKVACKDMTSSSICVKDSLPAWAIAIIVIGVVGVLAGGFLYWQRRKKAAGDSYENIPN